MSTYPGVEVVQIDAVLDGLVVVAEDDHRRQALQHHLLDKRGVTNCTTRHQSSMLISRAEER